ncbi:response regulator [Saccharibacillus sp. CPCC 101409]|uniref:response regulator n=1 Tax=Saccharibacillus sp. CPCC 101409 TaxID=3058041 RepID=UPI0026717C73|nr:response regulator [Saccharibacillus sp. CPCC 101409]MDO3409119.1 response regulator [Saccharibacillus sp. CPCC 101409]
MASFCIIDDDPAVRAMLSNIIEESGLGEVVGTARGGEEGARVVFDTRPDIVLIDWLMPDQDGLETLEQLKAQGFRGKCVMISQIEDREMVGEAYRSGIEFFIRKPINRIEVETVLGRVGEHSELSRYLSELRSSLSRLERIGQAPPGRAFEPSSKRRSASDVLRPIYMNLGILGEAGCADMTAIMENLLRRGQPDCFPPLRRLYEEAAAVHKASPKEIDKEAKAVEQRIRRTITAALTHLASLGLTDYGNPKFEHYAPLYFDFEDVRAKMKEIDEGHGDGRNKVGIKKFLQVMYLEMKDRLEAE